MLAAASLAEVEKYISAYADPAQAGTIWPSNTNRTSR